MASTTGASGYIRAETANYTMAQFDQLVKVDLTAGAVTITLPDATKMGGISVTVIRTVNAVNTLTVAAAGAQTVNGAASVTIATPLYSVGIFQSDGSNWFRVGTI